MLNRNYVMLMTVVIFLCSSFLGQSIAQSSGKPRVLDEFDFGKKISGEKVKFSIVVKNSTVVPVKILKVVASCGCVKASVETKVIPSGGEVAMQVNIDTIAIYGKFDKFVLVETDCKENPVRLYRLKGFLDSLDEVLISLPKDLNLSFKRLAGKVIWQRFTILRKSSSGVGRIKIITPDWIEASINKKMSTATRTILDVKVTVPKVSGRFAIGEIMIRGGMDAKKDFLRVPITVEVMPEINVTPDSLYIQNVDAYTFTIDRYDGIGVKIKSWDLSCKKIELLDLEVFEYKLKSSLAHGNKVTKKMKHRIVVKLKVKWKKGQGGLARGKLHLVLSDGKKCEVEIIGWRSR